MMRQIMERGEKWRGCRRSEEGSALVELALSLPLLCTMLLGAAEFARLAYAAIEVANAAHAAAVYGSSSHGAASDTPGIKSAGLTDAPNLVGSSQITVNNPTFSCECSDGINVDCTDNHTCTDSNTRMITTVSVTTQSTFSPMISLPGWKPTFTLQGKSSQVVSNH
jgi:Flp pilus assembly protein TadG